MYRLYKLTLHVARHRHGTFTLTSRKISGMHEFLKPGNAPKLACSGGSVIKLNLKQYANLNGLYAWSFAVE